MAIKGDIINWPLNYVLLFMGTLWPLCSLLLVNGPKVLAIKKINAN